MSATDTFPNVAEAATRVLNQESQNREALKYLLDFYLDKKDYLIAEKTHMGGTEAYVASVSLQWLAERVGFASELPLFREKIDVRTRQITIDESTINLIQQRPVDWSRQAPLAQYLAARKSHKFPPLLAVMSYPWVDDLKADEWDSKGRALRSSADFLPLDSKGRIGLINVSEKVSIYALDGQHRLMAVMGLLELIRTGSLPRKRKDAIPDTRVPVTVDELVRRYGITRSYIQGLASERIGIELIVAVVAGEDREAARRRVRSVFVHVNRMASPLTQGQMDQLNEDDGFAIVARRVATEHAFLKSGTHQDRVEWSAPNISERSVALTTLKTLREMAERYLGPLPEYRSWHPPEEGLIPLRPDDGPLEAGVEQFKRLWGLLGTLPSYEKLALGADTGSFRRFAHDKKPGEGHLLFRPVGQVALAGALGSLLARATEAVESLFEKLRAYDASGGFRLDTASSLWWMVLYDPNKKRMSIRGAPLAQQLLEYLLAGMHFTDAEKAKLRNSLANERTIHIGDRTDERWMGHEGQAMDFGGKWVSPDEIQLPPVI